MKLKLQWLRVELVRSEKTRYYQSKEIQEHLPLHINVAESKGQTPTGSKRGVSRGLHL